MRPSPPKAPALPLRDRGVAEMAAHTSMHAALAVLDCRWLTLSSLQCVLLLLLHSLSQWRRTCRRVRRSVELEAAQLLR